MSDQSNQIVVIPIWTETGIQTRRIVVSPPLEVLPYNHADYFDLEGNYELVPTSRLLATKPDSKGIANANIFMRQAAAGETSKRKPILVESRGGLLVVPDGNSTFTNALYSDWHDIPCTREPSAMALSEEPENLDRAVRMEEVATEVSKFMDMNEARYLKLLDRTRQAVEAAAEQLGSDKIYSTYSRGKKQGTNREIKDRGKIVAKLAEKRTEDPTYRLEYVVDIVGLTVVVYYPDQIELFVDAFEKAAVAMTLGLEPYETAVGSARTKVHRDKGYHATHIKVVSGDPSLARLRAEVQIKTMLHDAWGAKMHDLTYKPGGVLDPSLTALMEGFGDSLQSIELQSVTLRETILSHSRPLERLRRAARLQLMNGLENKTFEEPGAQSAYESCLKLIQINSDHLGTCPTDDPAMVAATGAIADLRKHGIDAVTRLMLTVYLASLRQGPDLAALVDGALSDLDAETSPDHFQRLSFYAATYHQTSRLDEAIATIRKEITGRREDPEARVHLNNLVNFLLERALHKPSADAKSEASKLIEFLEARQADLSEGELITFLSTKGAYLIVFGDDSELREGLALQHSVHDKVEPRYKGYCEMYLAYGWQRRFKSI